MKFKCILGVEWNEVEKPAKSGERVVKTRILRHYNVSGKFNSRIDRNEGNGKVVGKSRKSLKFRSDVDGHDLREG